MSTVKVACARWSPVSTAAVLSVEDHLHRLIGRPGDGRLDALVHLACSDCANMPRRTMSTILERQQMIFHRRRPQTAETRTEVWLSLFDADQLGADLADRLHRLQSCAGKLVFLRLIWASGLIGLNQSLFLMAGQRGGHLANGAKAGRIDDHAIARLDHGAAINRVVMDDRVFQRQSLDLQIRVDDHRIFFAAVPEIFVGRPGTGDARRLPGRDNSLRNRCRPDQGQSARPARARRSVRSQRSDCRIRTGRHRGTEFGRLGGGGRRPRID